jgi:hypothetical protein
VHGAEKVQNCLVDDKVRSVTLEVVFQVGVGIRKLWIMHERSNEMDEH